MEYSDTIFNVKERHGGAPGGFRIGPKGQARDAEHRPAADRPAIGQHGRRIGRAGVVQPKGYCSRATRRKENQVEV